ncbi:MAG: type IX secretion system protein PorQ [Chitinophagaceae bacterium]
MKKYILLFLLFKISISHAQVVGGERTFEFLRLSSSPHISALGGYCVSNPAKEISIAFGNPALLRAYAHTQLSLNYNFYYANTKVTNLLYGYHVPTIQTTFGLGLQYINYGKFVQTDNIGNQQGDFMASDYAIHFMASKAYLEKWRGGIDLKYAHSRLATSKSSAILADIGISYADTINKIYIGAVVKNAGIQLKKYNQQNASEPLPLDLQIGITKRFKKAPFSISILGHHLYQWNVRYDNPADIVDNTLFVTDTIAQEKQKTYFADKLFRHLVFSLDIKLGKRLELSAGYNHLRRSELSFVEKKGLSGFSFGAGLYLNKYIVHYARSYYHLAGAYNELGINFSMNRLFGFQSNTIHWNQKYADCF